jgi:hypothetical protein
MLNDNVTAIIKAFERPNAVINLYNSIREFYPKLKIIIVDDSKKSMDTSIFDENVEYIHTDFDIGLSAGRNLALSKVKTRYFLLLDDDFVFTENTKLEKMYKILQDTDFQIVGGGVWDFGYKKRCFKGKIFIFKNVFYLFNNLSSNKINGLYKYDYVLNFFMADTELVKRYPWDESLKLGEHEDFFYNLKKYNVNITDLSDKVIVNHFPEHSLEYDEYRKRVIYYKALVCKKYGFNDMTLISLYRLFVKFIKFIVPLKLYNVLLKLKKKIR